MIINDVGLPTVGHLPDATAIRTFNTEQVIQYLEASICTDALSKATHAMIGLH